MSNGWMHRLRQGRGRNMTEGGIFRNLILFALPLLAGNLFQQLYNMVDTWVIGQTGENGAYAAVGSVGPIVNILIGFFLGLSSGAGVVISQYFGAGNRKKVQDTVHTAMTLTLILCVVFTVLGLLMTPLFLNLMLHAEGEGGDIYPFARQYLTIYFSGVSGLMLYNMGSGILRAIGDSRRPFYFLLASAATNTVLDLLFVFVCGMGVEGVAYATIIAQALSAVLTVATLLRSDSWVRLDVRKLRIRAELLHQIVRIGIPAALQMAITAFSNVFVQSYIAGVNADRTYCLGGWTTYSKVDQFIFMPIQSLALSVTTFVGQNLGVGNVRRARHGTYMAYGMATAATVLLAIPVMLFAPSIAALFNADPHVVEYATLLLRTLTPFYLCSCVNQVFSASLRGAGNSRAPMVIMLLSFVAFRQVYLWTVSRYISNEILPIAMSYPAGWICCCILTLLYYHRVGLSNRMMAPAEAGEPQGE